MVGEATCLVYSDFCSKIVEVEMLNVKNMLKRIRDNYVINQVNSILLPNFEHCEICRRRFVFSGRVQNVGFRLEVSELAKRLNITGFCRNLKNGEVLAELQGPTNKINYLVSYMESLKRIKIKNKTVQELEINMEEKEFFK